MPYTYAHHAHFMELNKKTIKMKTKANKEIQREKKRLKEKKINDNKLMKKNNRNKKTTKWRT